MAESTDAATAAATSLALGQMSLRYTGLPSLPVAQGLGGDVDVQASRQRIGDHQRRRGEEIHLDFRMHAALEIAIAGQHRAGDDIGGSDGFGDFRLQGSGVADASGAAVTHGVKPERLQVGQQAGLGEVIGHHARARRERGLDPGLRRQAARARIARQQAGGHQHRGIRGVGAAGDGGDQHRAVLDSKPCRRLWPGRCRWRCGFFCARSSAIFLTLLSVDALRVAQRHAVLRTLGSGERGFDGRQVQFDHVGVVGGRRAVDAPQALRLGIGLDQRDLLGASAGQFQIADGFLIDGKNRAGRAELRRHVGDGGAVGERQAFAGRRRRIRRTCRPRPSCAASP